MVDNFTAKIARDYAKLRLTNVINASKKNKETAEVLAEEVLEVLEKECHYAIVEEKPETPRAK